MNPQEAKDYLQSNLSDMIVEVEENYSNQHAKNATRFIFTKGETKTNIMFKQGMKLDTELLGSVIEAIRKKFASVKSTEQIKKAKEEVEALAPPATPIDLPPAPAPAQSGDVSYAFYLAAKHVVETYERERPMT